MNKNKMQKILKSLSCAALLALTFPVQAELIITGNNSFVEGYLYVEDNFFNSVTEGSATYSPPSIYETEFYDDQGGVFDGYSFPPQYDFFGNPIYNSSSGWAGGGQNSLYGVDSLSGNGYANVEVLDPNNELSFIQASGESLVEVTFDVLTDYNYMLTGDLFSNSLGYVDLFFDGNIATQADGPFSFSGTLSAGTYTLMIDALAFVDGSQYATSGFNYDLQLTAVSAVPLPAAAWLFGSGLIGLIGFARRKKA